MFNLSHWAILIIVCMAVIAAAIIAAVTMITNKWTLQVMAITAFLVALAIVCIFVFTVFLQTNQ